MFGVLERVGNLTAGVWLWQTTEYKVKHANQLSAVVVDLSCSILQYKQQTITAAQLAENKIT